ncbi:DEAD/DEAH box helicase family protein [Bradyrhizobium sp. AUGA SZCCT0177]|uniref:DEAD/DEAH box helicase family protein n=1 Tax=Bradyrhizobium sp. AUGA SZCCT0177 TaxID=2807665 RepID=UPI001BA4EF8B|nr:DEAD/DEAH box helicase family protein [Bradyrhizobium sp. AUGA SZCCT0177]MBR1285382.1 DEAD/DEAH box helicase family protein [Bradyrhizobium sp. AUGA SZCCT0177]
MAFRDIGLPLSLKTTRVNPLSAFFVPVLRDAIVYDVAVGFFTTGWVRDAAEGIAQFACNGGKSRWIISPVLSVEDYQALKGAADILDRQEIEKRITHSFEELFSALKEDTRTVLGWLIRDRILEIRVGVPKNELSGMLHAKMGVFQDSHADRIGFSGSYNLTKRAATNWEKIDIYCAWKSDESRERVEEIAVEIDEMWDGKDSNLEIYKPSDEALRPFIRATERMDRPYSPPKSFRPRYAPPDRFLASGELRPYQREAIKAWLENNGQGVFSMATGSGKTVTALAAASQLANHIEEKQLNLLIVITVPYQHLANQWADDTEAFGYSPLVCYGGTNRWIEAAQQRLTALAAGSDRVVVFIVVNDTFSGEPFQKLVGKANRNMLLIADEMHNLGARSFLSVLPSVAKFRLGLSATPIRHGDEEGTRALESYFGKVVAEFSLGDAIKQGYLCPYYYHPVLAPLNDDEMAIYKDLSAQIAKAYAGQEDEEPNIFLQKLLIERARLISRLESKFVGLRDLMANRTTSPYNLVYCGDAKDEGEKQVDKVLQLIGHGLRMRASKFTSEESAEERKVLLQRFSDTTLQVLVAIRCLDEGVDVPRTETAYILASSTNPRQYIQRRGRVLRKAEGKSTATIYDFIAVPDLDDLARTHPSALETERRLVRKELERVAEFAQLSINPGETLDTLRQLKTRLHLTDY